MAPPSPSRPKSICTDKISAYSYNPMRVIALCDNDAFYASCERVRLDVDPEQPLVVQQWTNLIAVNYPARKFGITRHESDMMPAGGEMEKASIDEVFIDYTIPVRFLMLERYPQLRIPDGPFDLDTPLPVPPAHIDWAGLSTYIIPVTSDSPADNDATSRPITPSLTTEMALNSTDDMLVSLPIPTSPDPSPTDLTAVGSDAPPTWHDVALSIAAELMRDIRQTTFEKLGYTLSALSASYRKPMAQSVLRNVAIPGYLGPMPFQKIRFLGGKLGDAMATQFGATTVSELREIELVKERTALKSMMASKNVRPAITTTEQARHWLAVLSAELAVRLTDARKVNATVWPRTLVLHIRQGSNAPRSKQTAFPFARAFSAATILAPAEKLWRTLLPGTGDLSAGVINVALGFAGLDALEAGQKGIEGFFGTKGLNSSTKKATTSINGPMAAKSESLAPGSKARRTSSPAITDNKHQGKEHSSNLKRDFFNGAASNKRKAIVHEVLDDSSSDVVEISPPPTAKRVNSGSSGQAEPRSLTPTPISRDTKQRKPGSNDKDKAKNEKNAKAASKGTADIANFFAPRPGVTGAKTKGKK
ncbi:DNA polymerase eta subunit, partial [Rhizoctonia solani AG-3 Rhs1AP]